MLYVNNEKQHYIIVRVDKETNGLWIDTNAPEEIREKMIEHLLRALEDQPGEEHVTRYYNLKKL